MKKNIKLKKIMLSICMASLGITSLAEALPSIENKDLIAKAMSKKKVLTTYRTVYSYNIDKALLKKRFNLLESYLNVDMNNKNMKNIGNQKFIVKTNNSNSFIEIDAHSGNFLYKDDMTKYNSEETTPNLLNKKETLNMAFTHLENLNLMPKQDNIGTIQYSGLNMSVKKENGKTFDYKKTTAVRINRKIDGLPVKGSSRIFINMGSNGEISNMVYKWPKIEKRIAVLSKNMISKEMLKKAIFKQLKKRADNANKIILDKIDLVLYDNGKGLIEPAYYVKSQLFFKNKKSSYNTIYDFYIPAINNPQIIYPLMSKASVQPMNADKKTMDTIINNNE